METPITARGMVWARDVHEGNIPACQRARQAVARFFRDLDRAGTDRFPYLFDAAASEHLCAFVEDCPHIEGKWAARGETIRLSGWQAFLLMQLNGWRHQVTFLRRFRFVYVEVPRKNGKSTLMAAVGLYFLTVDGERGAKVFSAASSTDQARIVFDAARTMALTGKVANEPLSHLLRMHVEEHKIKTADPAAVFRPVAAQTKSQDGKNPHCALIDELHEHQKRDVWDAMASALGAREQPVMIAITTAGYNTAGICFEQRRYVERLLDEVAEDDSYLGLIFEADEGDQPGDPETWAKANPNLGVSKSLEYMQDEWRKASASPAAMGEFLRKHLDIWTSIGASAIDMDKWRAAEAPGMALADYADWPAWLGVDLAIRHDFASVVAVVPDEDVSRVFSWHFLPEEAVFKPGNEHFRAWAEAGWIRYTPGAMLDLNIVEALVLELAGAGGSPDWAFNDVATLDVQHVTTDPMFAAQMMLTWEQAGLSVIDLKPSARFLNEPFQRLIGTVENGRLVTDGNPVLQWMAANTLQKQVQGGDFIYPSKLSPQDKIDGVSALINALYPLCQAEEAAPVNLITSEKIIRRGGFLL